MECLKSLVSHITSPGWYWSRYI